MSPPRRKLVEQAPTWRAVHPPEEMVRVLQRMKDMTTTWDRCQVQRAALHWISKAGDVQSAEIARIALGVDQYGDPEEMP
jgi:hypothetical protein